MDLLRDSMSASHLSIDRDCGAHLAFRALAFGAIPGIGRPREMSAVTVLSL